ncbi:subtilisin-like protease SBT5.6 [Alnus glutinosa]|uniref:subtilisin-like protease SBT5.6 n=1 Tax=Alnus glutinosa TaxID=3517 RepID=UPI002D7A1938|nr:subtilisin-like protease SBT5.6 [Alnus glutinosa]
MERGRSSYKVVTRSQNCQVQYFLWNFNVLPSCGCCGCTSQSHTPYLEQCRNKICLMTTVGLINNMGLPLGDQSGNPATPFAYGSGHFRPTKASDPGLVYDASYTDYLLYLCSIGSIKCLTVPPTPDNLNYPSLAISKLNGTVTVKRTVTKVGHHKSVYFFTSRPPLGFSIKASPSILFFDHVGQKQNFTITVKVRGDKTLISKLAKDEYAFGWYSWTDG